MAKTVVEELAEANEKIQTVEAQAAEGVKALESMTAERDTALAASIAADEKATLAESEKTVAVDALAAEKTEHEKTTGALAESKTTLAGVLANPAFAAAAKQGLAEGSEDGGDAGSKPTTKDEALTAYRAISSEDPMEEAKMKAAFRAKNKDILGL